MIDLDRMEKALPNYESTHYEGCEYAHRLCALHALIAELRAAREVLKPFRAAFEAPIGSTAELVALKYAEDALMAYDAVIGAGEKGDK